MPTPREDFRIRNVKITVKQAISQYCREYKIHQATFLETDKRLKKYLK